jgi:hypothetical protein
MNHFKNCFNDANTAGCMQDLYFQFLNKQIKMPDKCFKLCPIECDSINYKIEQNSFQIPNNYSINKLDLNKYVNIFPSLKKWMLKQVKTHIKMHFN